MPTMSPTLASFIVLAFFGCLTFLIVAPKEKRRFAVMGLVGTLAVAVLASLAPALLR